MKLTPEELEKEWMAQSAISDYRNWLEAQVIKGTYILESLEPKGSTNETMSRM